MAEYHIKRLPTEQHGEDRFSVAKFDGGDQPEVVYELQGMVKDKTKFLCNCPSGTYRQRGTCKHAKMVRGFVLAGEPSPYVFNDA